MGKLISLVATVLLKPAAALKNLKDEGEGVGIVPSLIFVVVLSLVAGLIASVIGMVIPPAPVTQGLFGKGGMWALYMAVGPLLVLAGSFASAFFLWGITDGFFKGSLPQYKLTYRLLALTAAFYPISALITPIPKVGTVVGWILQAWVMIFVIWGLVAVKGAKILQTVLMVLITVVLLALAAVFGPRLSQGLAPTAFPNIGAGANEDFFGDIGETDEIDKMMEEQANKAAPAPVKKK